MKIVQITKMFERDDIVKFSTKLLNERYEATYDDDIININQ